jgi:hypothetical protein
MDTLVERMKNRNPYGSPEEGVETVLDTEDLIPEAMAPAAENFKILKRALDAGAVPVHDRVAIETAFEKISTRSYSVNPFGETPQDSPFNTLRIFAEKYHPSDTSNMLAKHANSKFRIGQAVKVQGREGMVTDIMPSGLLEIRYSPSVSGLSIPAYVEAA